MLVLDGSLSDMSSCLQRASTAFLIALFCSVALISFTLVLKRLNRQPDTSAAKKSGGKLGYYALCALGVAIMMSVSTVFGLARDRTVLFAENNQLIERGCVNLRSYEDRFILSGTRIDYVFHPKGSHGLRFQPSTTSRTLRVTLDFSRHLENLARIAPVAMSDYVAKLRELDKPIPAPLK